MSNFKFAWMSDTHLGYRQYGLERRERDFQLAFINAIQLVIDSGCEFAINSGDILHNNRPTAQTIMCLKEAHELLKSAGIPMWVVSGNHDFSEPHWVNTINPANDQSGIFLIDGKTVDYEGFTVYGCPWLPRDAFLASLPTIPKAEVIVWHGAIREFIGFPQASALKLDELPLDRCQLWAAGDIHVNSVKKVGSTYVGYPGSTEMNSSSEDFVKVVKVVSVEDGMIVNIKDLEIATRRVLKISISDEEEAQARIDELKKMSNGDRYSPMVYIEFPSDIGFDIQARFNSALNPNEFVLRFEQDPVVREQSGDYVAVATNRLTPEEVLYQILPMNSEILPVARRLIDPAQDANRILDEYIDAACK